MERVRFIPGIQWAANIMTGRQPFPYLKDNKPERKSEEGDFQRVLDREMARLEVQNGKIE